jgi:K+-transporting ATPase ATPase C chain
MVLNLKKFLQSFLLLALFTFILGGIYPLSIYITDKLIIKKITRNNDVRNNDKVIGTYLLGQTFTDPKYFWGRLESTDQSKRIERYNQFQNKHALPYIFSVTEFPPDFVTSSASGLDPHISYKSAMIQVDRVSRETGRYRGIIEHYILLSTEPRQFGVLGQPRINVVKLNLLIHGNQ